MAELIIVAGSVISLILGILILIFPKFLRIIVGLYFVLVGILGLLF